MILHSTERDIKLASCPFGETKQECGTTNSSAKKDWGLLRQPTAAYGWKQWCKLQIQPQLHWIDLTEPATRNHIHLWKPLHTDHGRYSSKCPAFHHRHCSHPHPSQPLLTEPLLLHPSIHQDKMFGNLLVSLEDLLLPWWRSFLSELLHHRHPLTLGSRSRAAWVENLRKFWKLGRYGNKIFVGAA